MAKYIVVHSVRVCTEFTPETFGRLTTIGPVFMLPVGRQGRQSRWQVCICECGDMAVCGMGNVAKGDTRSCGCLRKETTRTRATTHGMRNTTEYIAWRNMWARCSNTDGEYYLNYGGRGIQVYERWKKFENFFADMGRKPDQSHTLERRDNNAGYNADNCAWATRVEQCNNQRSNHMITICGRTDTLANWCRWYGIKYATVQDRINALGWSPILALTQPIHRNT